MKDLVDASNVLSIHIHQNHSRGIFRLSQKIYIENVFNRFGMKGCAPKDTLDAKGDKFSLDQCPKNKMKLY